MQKVSCALFTLLLSATAISYAGGSSSKQNDANPSAQEKKETAKRRGAEKAERDIQAARKGTKYVVKNSFAALTDNDEMPN